MGDDLKCPLCGRKMQFVNDTLLCPVCDKDVIYIWQGWTKKLVTK